MDVFDPKIALHCLNEDLQITTSQDFLTSDMSIKSAARLWLTRSLVKKLHPGIDTRLQDSASASLFMECNEACSTMSINPTKLFDDEILREAQHIIAEAYWCGVDGAPLITMRNAIDNGMTGPGASIDVKSNDFFTKMFDSTLSCTSLDLHSQYRRTIGGRWAVAENARQARHGLHLVDHSKQFFVPKDNKISRACCTEPNLNMFLQKGLGECINMVLRRQFSIDVRTQPEINAVMAQKGSIDQSFGTIDLKSASDRISTKLVEFLLPRPLFSLLNSVRAPSTVLLTGEKIELSMFSSMGNGFTFPLQTLIFASLVKATYTVMGVSLKREKSDKWGNLPPFSVFGDDIIVRREAYDRVVHILGVCGFIVNEQKSFNNGPFRESCGSDFWYGHDIRGIYIKKAIYEPHVYSTFNRLLRWSIRHNVSLTNLLRYIKGLARFRPVPLHAADHEGLIVPKDFLKSPKFGDNGGIFYHALTPVLESTKLGEDLYSTDGVLIAFIGGHIQERAGSLDSLPVLIAGKRPRITRYKALRRLTPHWDFSVHEGIKPLDLFNEFSQLFNQQDPIKVETIH